MTADDDLNILAAELFEENEDGELTWTDYGLQVKEILEHASTNIADDRVADLITSISDYMDEEVNGDIVDLKHMLLVALTGSNEDREAIVHKLAAEIQDDAVDAHDYARVSGKDYSSRNKDSVRGAGQSKPVNEDRCFGNGPEEAEEALAIFEDLSKGLSEEQVKQVKSLAEGCVYDPENPVAFRNVLEEHKRRAITLDIYKAAIARTARR